MKRSAFILGSVLVAVFAVSQSGVVATNKQFEEKFIVNGVTQKKGESGVYTFDKNHSFIGFKVKHLGLIKVPGFFRDFTGEINYNAEDVTKSSVNFTAKVDSVETGAAGRDAHLKRADFFDAEKFPEITFKSTKVAKHGDDLHITGDFTLRGVTKSISFNFDIEGFLPGNQRNDGTIGVSADTKINRFDYGVDYGKNAPAGSPGISSEVEIELEIEANKAKAPEAPKAAGLQ